jgi:hypothetical protein
MLQGFVYRGENFRGYTGAGSVTFCSKNCSTAARMDSPVFAS